MAVAFALLAAALFGLLSVAVRVGQQREPDPIAGAAATSLIGFATAAVISVIAGELPWDPDAGDAWRFFVFGLFVPGVSSILLAFAVRNAGPSRASVVIGAAPALSALLAITLLDEPLEASLVVGTALIVSGGFALASEQARPKDFRMIGLGFALACALLFAGRDNLVRLTARDVHTEALAAAAVSLAGAALANSAIAVAARRGRLMVASLRPYLLAGVSLGAAYSALLVALDHGRVVVVAPLNATQSLFAVLISLIVLKRAEMIGPRLVAAGALVVAGSAIIAIGR